MVLGKHLRLVMVISAALITGILLSSALYAVTGFSLFGSPFGYNLIDSDSSNAELVEMAYTVVEHIKQNDYRDLARYVHPELGVVFSPYATITLKPNLRFNAEQVAAFGSDRDSYIWGVRDGSGEPIDLTPDAYFSEFVFARDFSLAPVIGVNHIVRLGNALENITEVFPDVQFVDFHFPGSDADSMDGLSWITLRLGFEEFDGQLRLTVIARSVWTA